jgi:hypothetical protein
MKSLRTIVAAGLMIALVAPAVVAADGSAAKAEGSTTAVAAKGDLVPLELDLPKPMFVGTPKNTKSPNLERPKPAGWKRPDLLVPKGTKNLASKKEVTGSDDLPIIGEMEFVTDSDKEGSDGSFVEYGPGVQYVQIDLGEKCEIYGVVIWHYHAEGRVYRDVVVRVSDDKDFVKDVKDVFNNDHDNSAGLGIGKEKEYIEDNTGKLIAVKGVPGRYVRLYSNGSTSNEMNHYTEVEVYGKTLKELAK